MPAFNLNGNDYNSALVLGNGPTVGGRSYKGYSNNITILNDGLVAANSGGAGMSFSFSHWVPIYDSSMDQEITNYSNNPYGYSNDLNNYLKTQIVESAGNTYDYGNNEYRYLIGYTGTRLRHSSNEDIISNIKYGEKRLLEFLVDHDNNGTVDNPYYFYSDIHDEVLFKPSAGSVYKLLDSDAKKSKFIKFEGSSTIASTSRVTESYTPSASVDIIGYCVPSKFVNCINVSGNDYTLSRWLYAQSSTDEETAINIEIDETTKRHFYKAANNQSFLQHAVWPAYGSTFDSTFADSVSSISANAIPLNIANQRLYTGVHFTPQSLTSEGRVRGVYEIEDGSLGQNSIKFNKVLLFITVGTVVVPFAVISFAKTVVRDVTGKHGLQRVNISFVLDFKTDTQNNQFAPVQYGTGGWVQLKTATLSESENLNEVDTVLATQKGTWVYSFDNRISNITENNSTNTQQYVSKFLEKYAITNNSNSVTAGVLSGKINDGKRPFELLATVIESTTPNDNTITNRAAISSGILLSDESSNNQKGTYLVNTYSDYSIFGKTWTYLTETQNKENIPDSHATLGGFTYGLAFSKVVGQRGAIGKNSVLYGTGSEVKDENVLLIGDNIQLVTYDSDISGDDRSNRSNSLLALHTNLDGSNPFTDWHVKVRSWKSIVSGGVKNVSEDTNGSKTSTFLSSVGTVQSIHNGLIRNSLFNIVSYSRNTSLSHGDWDQQDIAYSTVIAGNIQNTRISNSSINAGGAPLTSSNIIASSLLSNSADGVLNSTIIDSNVWSNDEIQDSYIKGVNLSLHTDGSNVVSYGRFRYNSDNSGSIASNPVSKQIVESAGNSVTLFNANLGTIDGGTLTPYFYGSTVKSFKTSIAFRRLFVSSDVMVSSLERLPNGDVYDYADTYSPARTILIDNIVNSRLMGSFKTTGGRINAYNSDIHLTNNGVIYGTFVNSKIFGTQYQYAFFGDSNIYESDISIGSGRVDAFSYGSTIQFYTKKLFESNNGWIPYYNAGNNSIVNKHVVDGFDGVYSIARKNTATSQAIISSINDVSGEFIDSSKHIYVRKDTGVIIQQQSTNTVKNYLYSVVDEYNAKNIADFTTSTTAGSVGIIDNGSYGKYVKSISATAQNGTNLDTIERPIIDASSKYIAYNKSIEYMHSNFNNPAIDVGNLSYSYKKQDFRSVYGLPFGDGILATFNGNLNTAHETLVLAGTYSSSADIYDTESYNRENEFNIGGGSGTNVRRLDSSKKFGVRLSQRLKQLNDKTLTEESWQPGQNRQLVWHYIGETPNDNGIFADQDDKYKFVDKVLSPIAYASVNGSNDLGSQPNRVDYHDFVKQGAITLVPNATVYNSSLKTYTESDFIGMGNPGSRSIYEQNLDSNIFHTQLLNGFAKTSTSSSYSGSDTQAIDREFNVRLSQSTDLGFANILIDSTNDKLDYIYDGFTNDAFGKIAKRFNTIRYTRSNQSFIVGSYADQYYDGFISKYTLATVDAPSGVPAQTTSISSIINSTEYYDIDPIGFDVYRSDAPTVVDSILSRYKYTKDLTVTQRVNSNLKPVNVKQNVLVRPAKIIKQSGPGVPAGTILPINQYPGYIDGSFVYDYYLTINQQAVTVAGLNLARLNDIEAFHNQYNTLDNCVDLMSGSIIRYSSEIVGTEDTYEIDRNVTIVSEGMLTEYLLARKQIATDKLQANNIEISGDGAVYGGNVSVDPSIKIKFEYDGKSYDCNLKFAITPTSLPNAVGHTETNRVLQGWLADITRIS